MDEIFDVTGDEQFKATHEIGHVLIAERFGINWDYVTIESDDPQKGGHVHHNEDFILTEDNLSDFVMMKMAGEAILLAVGYNKLAALMSSSLSSDCDRENAKEMIAGVNWLIDVNRYIQDALTENERYFSQSEMRKKTDFLVAELVSRKTINRQEFLELLRE